MSQLKKGRNSLSILTALATLAECVIARRPNFARFVKSNKVIKSAGNHF